jgi:glycosyltransferase involved in cell wall biosynthesis
MQVKEELKALWSIRPAVDDPGGSQLPLRSSAVGTDPARPMRVLFATNITHLPQSFGGSQSATAEFCEALISQGWNCVVLAALAPEGLLGLRARLLGRSLGWPRVPPDRVCGYPVYRRWSPSQDVAEMITRFDPSIAVVMAGNPKMLIEPLLANGVPTVCYLHDAEPGTLNFQPPDGSRLAFLACSQFMVERAKQALGVEATFIPPIVAAPRYRVTSERLSVIVVNPIAVKGVEVALHLAGRRPDIPFDFVECWDLANELTLYRKRASAYPNITWHKPTLDMRRIYARGRMLLVPSQRVEAWGRVVTEAQASGIPVLASRNGGLPESVGPGGVLVEPDSDFSVWEEALTSLWDDREVYERYSRAAYAHAGRLEIDPSHVLCRFVDCLLRHHRQSITVAASALA